MVIKEKLYSECEKEFKNLFIYLPEDYETSEERYPVMYYFDGHNLFDDADATYGKSWGLRNFLDSWEKKIIVVGVECSHAGNHRLSEYCPYPVQAFGADIKGDGKATMDWMAYTLKPYIDKKYRTYSFREATGIGGSSMGGLMSVYAAAAYNDIYSKAACLSPSTSVIKNEIFADIRNHSIDPDTRVYIAWGEFEGGEASGDPSKDTWAAMVNRRTAELFADYGCATRVYYQKGGHHREADWEKQNGIYMDFLWLDR